MSDSRRSVHHPNSPACSIFREQIVGNRLITAVGVKHRRCLIAAITQLVTAEDGIRLAYCAAARRVLARRLIGELGMAKCIFCERQLTAGSDDGTEPTKEHIIQYALGGSNGVVTHDVCKDCNSKLGETVDADFINQEFMGFLRLTHGIEGYSGKIPDVLLSACSLDTNEPGHVTFGSVAKVDVSHEPVVIRDAKADGIEEILVAGMPDRALEIATGIIDKAKKKNRTVFTTNGSVANSAEDLLAGAETETSIHYKASMKVQLIPLLRGYAKIAFGFLHLALGEQWTFSKDAGALRAISRGEGSDDDVKNVVVQGDTQIRSLFLGPETANPRTHLLGIILKNDPVVLVSLFGGTFTYGFKVSVAKDLYCEALLSSKVSVEVDPVSRQANWISYQKILQRMNSFGR